VPRGAENAVAIDLILQHIRLKLMVRGRLMSPYGSLSAEASDSSLGVAAAAAAAAAVVS
jgi:hypothetical protein